MTELLEKGIDAVRELSRERQDAAGQILLVLAAQERSAFVLTATQLAEVYTGLAEADRGEFATETEMDEVWQPGR